MVNGFRRHLDTRFFLTAAISLSGLGVVGGLVASSNMQTTKVGNAFNNEWFLNKDVYGVKIGMKSQDAKRILISRFPGINFDEKPNTGTYSVLSKTGTLHIANKTIPFSIYDDMRNRGDLSINWLGINSKSVDGTNYPISVDFVTTTLNGNSVISGFDIRLPYSAWNEGLISKPSYYSTYRFSSYFYIKSFGSDPKLSTIPYLDRIDSCVRQTAGSLGSPDFYEYYKKWGCIKGSSIPISIYAYVYIKKDPHPETISFSIRDARFLRPSFNRVVSSLEYAK